jgi:sulfur carrier protein
VSASDGPSATGSGTVVHASVNGRSTELPAGTTVAQVVASLGTEGRGVAVALDGEVVPRSRWGHVTVADGSRLEVVTAAAGG